MVRIAALPESDRPRERLLRDGVNVLSDVELVAILLGSGSVGASAIALAQQLLAAWGGVAGLATARPEELTREAGVGPAKAARIAAAFAVGSRRSRENDEVRLATSEDVARAARRVIGTSAIEKVAVLVADGGFRLKRFEVVAVGTAKACPMPVREILALVLRHDGAAFAVAHNHPGGDCTPTAADARATVSLRDAAAVIGLRFLDHVIVTSGPNWRSLTAIPNASRPGAENMP